ncbi:MAG TPA: type II secretion system protein GspG [Candidatus Ozemobacteraceae bacterium]|nr:type II secretion system protein GspG [Candidatus Ozemobacteraceae bacterium]
MMRISRFRSLDSRGFNLIELMVALIIIATLVLIAIREYAEYVQRAKITKAQMDLEELGKSVRMYNTREDQPFRIATFTVRELGRFVGTYLEKEPPSDPWGRPYRHNADLGVVYSVGPDGLDSQKFTGLATMADDIIVRYIPAEFFITKAEYVDANRNNLVDFGDRLDIHFSRPAMMTNVTVFDFLTKNPERALGSAIIASPAQGKILSFLFAAPVPPKIRVGETTIVPREFIESVIDCSPQPQPLRRLEEVVIQRKRM